MYQIRNICGKCGHTEIFERSFETSTEIKCAKCGAVSSVIKPINGYIYVLSNRYTPGMLKIGFTTRKVEERINELSSPTGVPGSFEIEATFISDNPQRDEWNIHFALREERESKDKEFFHLDSLVAIGRISTLMKVEPNYLSQKLVLKRSAEEAKEKSRIAAEIEKDRKELTLIALIKAEKEKEQIRNRVTTLASKMSETEKREMREQLALLGIFSVDPGSKIAQYAFTCKICEQKYYSRNAKTNKTLCPHCFTKEIV